MFEVSSVTGWVASEVPDLLTQQKLPGFARDM